MTCALGWDCYFCSMEKKKVMLGLRLPTDPRWVEIVEGNIEEILTDHAYCEQKATTNAITNIVRFPEYSDMVEEMTRIAQEEIQHFGMVHQELLKRGLTLGRERKDPYVHDLATFILHGGGREEQFVDRMLFGAMIEARSCERFRLLSERIADEDLKKFYYDLMVSEADHYTTFITLARKYGKGVDVDERWQECLDFEASLMEKYGKRETIHG